MKEEKMSPLSDKEKMDGLLQLAKIHRQQFDERRRTEWKLVLVVLAFYFSLITAKITDKLDSEIIQSFEMGVVIFGIALVAIVYLGYIHDANYKNKRAARNAEHETEDILGYKGKIFKENEEENYPWANWSSISQWILIGLIALGTFVILRSA